MQDLGLPPDGFTFVALLGGMAKAGCSLLEVDAVAAEVHARRIQVMGGWGCEGGCLGTVLLNASEHVPCMGSTPPHTHAHSSTVC